MQCFKFQLKLTRAECMFYYEGQARYVIAQTREGRKVQFPANRLRSFITASGVNGDFEMCVDDHKKIISFKQLS